VAGGTGTDAAAGVVDLEAGAGGDVEEAARFAGAVVGNLGRVDLEGGFLARFLVDEGDLERPDGERHAGLFDVRVNAGHGAANSGVRNEAGGGNPPARYFTHSAGISRRS